MSPVNLKKKFENFLRRTLNVMEIENRHKAALIAVKTLKTCFVTLVNVSH